MENKSINFNINSGPLCQNKEQVNSSIYAKYYSNQSFKDEVDSFLTDFNESNETSINFSELFSRDYDDKKIDLEKAIMLNRFLEELLIKFNIKVVSGPKTLLEFELHANDERKIVINVLEKLLGEESNLLANVITEYLIELKKRHKNILYREQFKNALFNQISGLDSVLHRAILKKILENLKKNDIFSGHYTVRKGKSRNDNEILTDYTLGISYPNKIMKDKVRGYFGKVLGYKLSSPLSDDVLKLLIDKLVETPLALEDVINLENWELLESIQSINETTDKKPFVEQSEDSLDIIGLDKLTLKEQKLFIIKFFTFVVTKLSQASQKKINDSKKDNAYFLARVLFPIKKEDTEELKEMRSHRELIRLKFDGDRKNALENQEAKRSNLERDLRKMFSDGNRTAKMNIITKEKIFEYVKGKGCESEAFALIGQVKADLLKGSRRK